VAAAARPPQTGPATATARAVAAIAHAKARRRLITCTENPTFPVALVDALCV